MSIILDERKWAEYMDMYPDISKKPLETLSRMSRYYTYLGCTKAETRKRLEGFLVRCPSSVTAKDGQDMIDAAIKYGAKAKLFIMDGVEVTKPEMEIIDSLGGRQLRRLAFTLLCLSKYL